MDGLWSSPDLPGLLRLAARNREALALSSGWFRVPAQLARTVAHRARPQHAGGQPAQHRGPLRPRQRLLPALPRRIDDVLERGLRFGRAVAGRCPGEQVPAARGQRRAPRRPARPGDRHRWGGFALYAAGELGCRVTTITISKEQFELARQRVHDAGLDDLVDVQLRDYRDVEGTYDAIVSIEMLEAVGAEYLATFFETCDRALRPGRPPEPAGHHLSGCRLRATAPGRQLDPDVHLPGRPVPLARGHRAGDAGHAAADPRRDGHRRRLRAHAGRLADAFLGRLDEVRALGFDDRFIRMWEYYLALSEAGFATGMSQDLQIVMEKARGVGPDAARDERDA